MKDQSDSVGAEELLTVDCGGGFMLVPYCAMPLGHIQWSCLFVLQPCPNVQKADISSTQHRQLSIYSQIYHSLGRGKNPPRQSHSLLPLSIVSVDSCISKSTNKTPPRQKWEIEAGCLLSGLVFRRPTFASLLSDPNGPWCLLLTDIKPGLKACCCPCVVSGRIKHRLDYSTDQGYKTFNDRCLIFSALACCGCSWVLQFQDREKLIERHDSTYRPPHPLLLPLINSFVMNHSLFYSPSLHKPRIEIKLIPAASLAPNSDLQGSQLRSLLESFCCPCCEMMQTQKQLDYHLLSSSSVPNGGSDGYQKNANMELKPQHDLR